jgi:hypothetical protein
MNEIVSPNARSLSFKRGSQRCTLEFDTLYLTRSRQTGPAVQITKTPLWRIMPELLIDRSIPESARQFARMLLFSSASAIVVYFSDLPLHVPLLLPALVICAAWCAYQIIRVVWPLEKTKILSDSGGQIGMIPHDERIDNQRKLFEQALLHAVRQARHRHLDA